MLVLSALVALVLVAATSGQNCQNGTEWNYCATNCMKFCWDMDPWCEPQSDVCVGKCECPSHRPIWFNNACVTEWACIEAGYSTTTVLPEPTPSRCSRCTWGACDWDGSCDYGCVDGFYGEDCSMDCSDNCLLKSCDQGFGYCIHGCIDGSDGPFCEDNCKKGCVGYGGLEECETYDDYMVENCPRERHCYDCKCQGEECVDGRPRPSSAPVLISSTLLLLFTVCSINMLA